jgi:hypothetical protein
MTNTDEVNNGQQAISFYYMLYIIYVGSSKNEDGVDEKEDTEDEVERRIRRRSTMGMRMKMRSMGRGRDGVYLEGKGR